MPISRREWLSGAGGFALGSPFAPAPPADVRDDFPIAKSRVYLNNASIHPMSLASLEAAQEYLRARTHGAGPTTSPDPPVPTREAKEGFAALIGFAAEVSPWLLRRRRRRWRQWMAVWTAVPPSTRSSTR